MRTLDKSSRPLGLIKAPVRRPLASLDPSSPILNSRSSSWAVKEIVRRFSDPATEAEKKDTERYIKYDGLSFKLMSWFSLCVVSLTLL